MPHFGVLSYNGAGHLNPLVALSCELTSRGHTVTFFLSPDKEDRIRRLGFGFVSIDTSNLPRQAIASAVWSHLTTVDRMRNTRGKLRRVTMEMMAFLQQYPPAIRDAGVDALIMGEISFAGPTVAEMLGLPYFVVSTSIPHNFGWHAPRSVVPRKRWLDRLQQKRLEVSIFRMRGPIKVALNKYRQKAGLGSIHRIRMTHPELAHITQWPRCLDYPRTVLPRNFHYVGPLIDEATRDPVEFPWDRLDKRPIVYVSLGTTKRGELLLFSRIAEACNGLNLQVVVSLGNRRDSSALGTLPGDPIIVRNAPQLELLKKASVVVTHAGPNTVLESLLEGKPMLALPIALDQPAVAAHVARLGAAEVLAPHKCSSTNIRLALTKLITDSQYRSSAQRIQEQLKRLHGTSLAAEIIEESLVDWNYRASSRWK